MDANAILLVLIVGLPIAALVIWLFWRACVWCLCLASIISLWLLGLPTKLYIPLMVILAIVAWPLALLALFGWMLLAIFPGLMPEDNGSNWKPRLRAR